MENMFRHLASVQANPASQTASTQPHIVSITPLSAILAAIKPEEPIGSTPAHPQPALKKGLANIKGSSVNAC